MCRSTDRLHVTSLSPRQQDAFRLIEERPGITIAEPGDALGVGAKRVWQLVDALERSRVRRDPPRPPMRRGPR